MTEAARRIAAIVLRHWYLIRGSWPRYVELAYWPFVHLLMWGFLQNFLMSQESGWARIAGILVGAVFLWEVLFRAQMGFSISFLEEMWSRNLGALMVSPMRNWEMPVALMLMSWIRSVIGLIPAALLASWAFGFSFWDLGFPMIGFFLNLSVFGWSIALLACGVVLRNGLGSESLVWACLFLFLPVSCVYYPVASLPDWLQPVALALPSAHVFEGLRAILLEDRFAAASLWKAALLNGLYLSLGLAAFQYFLRSARRRGMLLQLGE